jgi:GT2 family glycosyltransferase
MTEGVAGDAAAEKRNSSSGPSSDLGLQLEHARRRIGDLERDLAKHGELFTWAGKIIQKVYASRGWKLVFHYYRLRNRLRHFGAACQRLGARLLRPVVKLKGPYPRWIREHEPGPAQLEEQRQTRLAHEPLISILVPLRSSAEPFLAEAVRSVFAQTYGRWELCLVCAGSPDAAVEKLLGQVGRDDVRIRLVPASPGRDTARAALEAATGEYVAFLDPADTLAPFALFEVARAVNREPGADFLYSDEDSLSRRTGVRKRPHFKPDWAPDTLRSYNYIGNLAVYRRDLIDRVGGPRPAFEGWERYDLVLRATEQASRIVHVPQVLYHRRSHERRSRPPAVPAETLVAQHLARLGTAGEIKSGGWPGVCRVAYALPTRPLVSIIIPNRDNAALLARCVSAIARSDYTRHEIIIVENHSTEKETFAYYDQLARRSNVRILTWKESFNYSAVNNLAAARSAGEVLLFLNNDVQAIAPSWLECLLEHALRPEVGAVGAKLYYPNNTVQHAGIIVSRDEPPQHCQRFFPRASTGYANRLVLAQNVSAVTAACLMTRKAVFQEVGGFEEKLVIACNDVDLCLKIRQKGYRIVWTPYAELYHFESHTRGRDETPEKLARALCELTLFHWKWSDFLAAGDPYYHPSLAADREDCALRM